MLDEKMSMNYKKKSVFLILLMIFSLYAHASKISSLKIDAIVVHKKERELITYHGDSLVKKYKIALGFSPLGHKEKEGDGKTPEGIYRIISKNPKSQFHLSLKISYPSPNDIKNAKKEGVSPGGDIMIHGLGKKWGVLGASHRFYDWTLGCIALTDKEIEEIYAATEVGAIIEIKP